MRMVVKTKSVSPRQVFKLAQTLPPTDLRWVTEQLQHLIDDEPLPESATLEEAIELFLADKCSLGRTAELAGVTRWDIQAVLKERDIPLYGGSEMTVEEMEDQIERFEQLGVL